MQISEQKLIHILGNELFDWLVTLRACNNIKHIDQITLVHVDNFMKQVIHKIEEEGEEHCQGKLL